MPTSVDLRDLAVVDGHCHPIFAARAAPVVETIRSLFSESRPGTMPEHVAQTGFFRRGLRELGARWGIEPTVEAVTAWCGRARSDAGRCLADARVASLIVDTGYPPDAMPLNEMRDVLPCGVHEVFRIETCAQRLLEGGLPYEDFAAAFREELRTAARRAVAFKSIIAYRSGLAVRVWEPAEVARAYGSAVARANAGG